MTGQQIGVSPKNEHGDVLTTLSMPLQNVEYTIERYLLENGTRLDTETRCLLAGVRDCVSRVAGAARHLDPMRSAGQGGA